MKLVILFIVLVSVLALTTAKPITEDNELIAKREEKSGAEDELENSGDSDDEDEEDGSTIDDDPRAREKRGSHKELKDNEETKDSSGNDPKEGSDEIEETNDSSGDENSQKNELQWKNSMGIGGPFTITAFQPAGLQNPSSKKQKDQVAMDAVSPTGNFEITPFAPKINGMKKLRRRCLCPFPCGAPHEFEVIGCSGPYTYNLPCGGGFGGFWPGIGCGGYGYGGYGLGGPWFRGPGYGGCGGFGGFGGCGGYGLGCCGGGGGFGAPFPCCCCKKEDKEGTAGNGATENGANGNGANGNGANGNGAANDMSKSNTVSSKPANTQENKPLADQSTFKVKQPLTKVPKL